MHDKTTEGMQKTILLAQLELEKQRNKKRSGFGEFLMEQMRITGVRIWMTQIGIVLMVYLLLYSATGVEFRYFTARRFAFLTGILGIVLFLSTIPFLYRAKRYRMVEIEAVAKYSIWELLLSRILIISIGDFVMIFGIVWQIAKFSPFSVMQTIVWLCLPFLLAFNGGIYLLRKAAFVRSQKLAYGMCGVMCGILGAIATVCPINYEMTFLFVAIGGAALIGGIAYQCTALLRENVREVYE